MAVSIAIPTALRAWSGGNPSVSVEASTVAEAMDALLKAYPQMNNHLRDAQGKLRSFVNLYLNDEDVRFLPGKEAHAVREGDVLTIVPSIAGGAR